MLLSCFLPYNLIVYWIEFHRIAFTTSSVYYPVVAVMKIILNPSQTFEAHLESNYDNGVVVIIQDLKVLVISTFSYIIPLILITFILKQKVNRNSFPNYSNISFKEPFMVTKSFCFLLIQMSVLPCWGPANVKAKFENNLVKTFRISVEMYT